MKRGASDAARYAALMMERFLFGLSMLLTVAWGATAQPVLMQGGEPEQLDAAMTEIADAAASESWSAYNGRLSIDDGVIWFRQPITLSWANPAHARNPLAVTIQLSGLYEAYWDGVLVGSNRHRGSSATQFSRLMLPVSHLQDGEHWLYFRIEGRGLEAGENVGLGIFPTELSSDFFGVHFTVIIVFLVSTTSFIASAYFLSVGGRGDNVWTCRVAALITFLTGSLMYLDRARFLTPYPYGWQPAVDTAMAAMTIVFLLSLAGYGALRLRLPRPPGWAAGALAVMLLALLPLTTYDTDTKALLLLGFYMLGMGIYAFRRNNQNAPLMMAAVGAGMVALFIEPDQKMLFVATVTILFGIELAIDLFRRTREAQRLALLSARLRGDLLKHNIKPHFLMNSLTALMEWIETSPEQAVSFIDGMAEEFRLLSDFSDRRSVSLHEELALCRVHLDLMSQRLDSAITLVAEEVDLDDKVPPALLHTLVENAFSHNDYRSCNLELLLRQQPATAGRHYVFSVPMVRPRSSPVNSGLGTKYVESRLEEFCGKAFSFHSEQIGSDWVSHIKLHGD